MAFTNWRAGSTDEWKAKLESVVTRAQTWAEAQSEAAYLGSEPLRSLADLFLAAFRYSIAVEFGDRAAMPASFAEANTDGFGWTA